MADLSIDNLKQKLQKVIDFNSNGSMSAKGHIAIPFLENGKIGVKVYDYTSYADKNIDKELEFLSESLAILENHMPEGVKLQSDTLLEYLLDVTSNLTDFENVGSIIDEAIGFFLAAKGNTHARTAERFNRLMWASAMQNNVPIQGLFARIINSPQLKQWIIDNSNLPDDASDDAILTAFIQSVLTTNNSILNEKFQMNVLITAAKKFKELYKSGNIQTMRAETTMLDRRLDYLMNPDLYGRFPNLINYQDEVKAKNERIDKTITDLINNVYMSIAQRQSLARKVKRNLGNEFFDTVGNIVKEQNEVSDLAKQAKESIDPSKLEHSVLVGRLTGRLKVLDKMMEVAISDVDNCIAALQEVPNNYENQFKQADQIKMILDYLMSYSGDTGNGGSTALGELIPQMEAFIKICEEEGIDVEYLNAVKERFEQTKSKVIDVNNLLKNEGVFQRTFKPIFRRMLQQIAPDGAILRENGEVIDVNSDEITEVYKYDISWLSMYINAMFNQPNDMVRMFKQLVDQKNQEARMKEIHFMDEHHAATMKFIKAWKADHEKENDKRYNMYDFMFRRTSNPFAWTLAEFLNNKKVMELFGNDVEAATNAWKTNHGQEGNIDNLDFIESADPKAYEAAAVAYRDELMQSDEFKELENDVIN